MAAVPEDVKMLIRAVLGSKDGGVLETEFGSDFRKVANEFLEHYKYGCGSVKELMLSMPDVVRVEFDTRHNVDRYIGVPKPGQFLSKPAQKAMRISGSEDDSEGSNGNKRRRGGRRHRSGGSSGGKGDAPWGHKVVTPCGETAEELKTQLVGSQNDKGMYALCFPQAYLKKFGEATVRNDFNAAGDVAEENTFGSYSFVRYRTLLEAQNAAEMWAVKYDLRVPTDRLKMRRAKSASKPKSPKKNKIGACRVSGPDNPLTRAARPGPEMPIATDHGLDPSLPIVCIRNLPADARAHALMTEFGISPRPGYTLLTKKFKQSIAFVAFPDDDMCGETAARNFIKRYQGHLIGGAPISLSMVSGGVSSSDDTMTTTSQEDTIDMESLHSVLVEESLSDTSSVTSKTIADVDNSIIAYNPVGIYRYGQPDGAESDPLAIPPGLIEGDDLPPGIEMEEPPGLEEDDMSEIGSTHADILITLKLSDFPYHTTSEELLTVLRPFGVYKVRIINNINYYHCSKAVIEVTMHQAHRIIQALDNSTFKNRLLKVTPDGTSKMRMLRYAKMVDPEAFPENTPVMFQPPRLEQLMSECGTFKFLAGSIDVSTRMAVYVTHVERENADYVWAVKIADYTGLTSMEDRLRNFRSDRQSKAQRGIIRDRDSMNNWHRVWVNLVLPDDYLYVVSVDRGRPFTIQRSNYMYLPDSFWNAEPPCAIPMKICERRRSDLRIVANNGVYHVQPVDLIDNVLYVSL